MRILAAQAAQPVQGFFDVESRESEAARLLWLACCDRKVSSAFLALGDYTAWYKDAGSFEPF